MPELRHIWAALPTCLTAAAFGLFPLRSWDYWWHVIMGRVGRAAGTIPDKNYFLYTLDASAESIIQPWLSQRLLSHAHELLGLSGVLLGRNLMAVVGVAALTFLVHRARVSWRTSSLAVLLVSVPVLLVSLEPRTFLFVWPLFIGALVLARAIRRRAAPIAALAAFPLLTALWANLHGSFIVPSLICVAMFAAALLDRWRRPDTFEVRRVLGWAAVVVSCWIAAACNPHGFGVYEYLAQVASDPVIRQTVSEWWPTLPWQPWGVGTLFWVCWPGGLALMAARRRHVDLSDVFLLLGFGLMAWMQSRALLWFALAAPLALSEALATLESGEADDDASPVFARVINALLLVGLIFVAGFTQPGSPLRLTLLQAAQPTPTRLREPMVGLVELQTPVEAAAWLREHPRERVFCDPHWSGYLLAELQEPSTPTQMVCVDQRIELPGPDVWAECDAVLLGEPGWSERLDRWRVGAVIVDKAESSQLIEGLRRASGWELIGESERTILFARDVE